LLLIDRPEAPQSELCLGHLGLPRNHADYSLAAVANALLGGKFTSRINLKLREEHACTYGAHSSFAKRRGAGPFTVTAAIDNDAVPLAIREVLRELDRLRQETVPEDELAETIDYLIGSFPYSCETLAGIVHRLSDLAIFQLPKTYYDELPAALAAVTPDEIMRCARQHIHPHRAVIVVAGPADSLTNQLADIAAVERP
ncbi:MAG: insulinase family protein, partial [Acidobacteriota bacterium]|nr:insulinase family protein [Acidobacteriota bacterium]